MRIRGPKGAFRVEMQRESQKDRTILCKYEPTEPGDYRIEVRQGVPGEPECDSQLFQGAVERGARAWVAIRHHDL